MPDNYAQFWAELPTLLFLPLTKGKFAVIDAVDYPLISNISWNAVRKGPNHTHWYACGRPKGVKNATSYMHRVITGAPKGMEVDHKRGSGLDNRRENMRVCTHKQNLQNKRSHKGRLIGVEVVECGKIIARFDGRRIGTFNTPEEAGRAWDAKAREVRGEFAYQNYPSDERMRDPSPLQNFNSLAMDRGAA